MFIKTANRYSQYLLDLKLFTPSLLSFILLQSSLSFFNESTSDSFLGEEGDLGFLSSSDNEQVGNSSSEVSTCCVLNVSNIEWSWMLFNVLQYTNSTNVVSSCQKNLRTIFELDESFDLSSLQIQLIRLLNINYIGKEYLPSQCRISLSLDEDTWWFCHHE